MARPRVVEPRGEALRNALRNVGLTALVFIVSCLLWEAYKWFGERVGLTKPFPVNERTMPHVHDMFCLLYTSPSPRDLSTSRMPSSA